MNDCTIKLAVVGFRDYTNYAEFKQHMDKEISLLSKTSVISEIVSGGCRGTDKMAERYAAEHGIKMIVFAPNWTKYPWTTHKSAAYIMRDQEIAKYCTHMIAFPSSHGKGTQATIAFAAKFKKPCTTVFIS